MRQQQSEEMNESSEVLQSAGQPAAETKQVRGYDFVHPDKLSKLNLRALEIIFTSLEKSWAAVLSTALRSETFVQLNSMEQAAFSAHAESFPESTLIVTVSLSPLPGAALLDMPKALALSLVDRLAGGKGEPKGEPRDLTQIELSILRRFLNRLLGEFSAAWTPVARVEARVSDIFQSLEDLEMDPQSLLLAASMNWNACSSDHKLSIAVPVNSLDPVLDALDPQRWAEQEGEREVRGSAVAELMDAVAIPIAIDLGGARVSVQELVNMGVGDIIRLDGTVNDLLDIRIGGHLRFQGRPGLVGKHLAVQITGRTHAEKQEVVDAVAEAA